MRIHYIFTESWTNRDRVNEIKEEDCQERYTHYNAGVLSAGSIARFERWWCRADLSLLRRNAAVCRALVKKYARTRTHNVGKTGLFRSLWYWSYIVLRILRNANRIKLCRFLLQYHSKDQAGRQRKLRSSRNEVDDDRPIYSDSTTFDNETRLTETIGMHRGLPCISKDPWEHDNNNTTIHHQHLSWHQVLAILNDGRDALSSPCIVRILGGCFQLKNFFGWARAEKEILSSVPKLVLRCFPIHLKIIPDEIIFQLF